MKMVLGIMYSSLFCSNNEEVINTNEYLKTLLLYVYHTALILAMSKVLEFHSGPCENCDLFCSINENESRWHNARNVCLFT
jgi:hypothetical protein